MEKKLRKTRVKLEKAEEKLSNAQNKIHRKNEKSKLRHKKEPKSKLNFEEDRPKPSEKLIEKVNTSDKIIDKKHTNDKLIQIPKQESKFIKSVKREVLNTAHKQIEKYEDDNIGLKAIHKTEKSVEFAGRKVSQLRQYQKLKPYKNLLKAEQKATNARVNYELEKNLAQNPQLASNPISKYQQKKRIRKQYANAYRSSYKTTSNVVKGTVKKGVDVVNKVVLTVAKDPKVLVILLIIMFLIFIIVGVSSSVSTLLEGTLSSFISSSYTSEDEELLKVEENYVALEQALQKRIDNIESEYPGYDEYRYDLAEIGHNPHELASYFTALLTYYTADEVSSLLQDLFNLQYVLTITSETEIRYRTETREDSWVDSEGVTHTDSYEVEVPYEYYILNVSLVNNAIDTLAMSTLSTEQQEMYNIYRQTKGNKPDLFGEYIANDVPINYQIPGDALTDPEFAALINEAEKYIGYPYVWGVRP